MTFEKLLKCTIAGALDEVWSKSGVTPSKKTRATIIKAVERISQDVKDDFMKANKANILAKEKWEDIITVRDHRRKKSNDDSEFDEPVRAVGSFTG